MREGAPQGLFYNSSIDARESLSQPRYIPSGCLETACSVPTALAPAYSGAIRDFFEQVADAGEGPHFYLALSGALVIPDMCGAMASDDGCATGARYADWFDTHVASNYPLLPDGSPFLSGADCYRLRCSFLHQGTTQHDRSAYSRVIFTEPASNTFHLNILNDALNVDIRQFCTEVATGALTWLSEAEATDNFQQNFPKFVQRYPEGLPPYMVGIPLIS